MHSLLIRFKLLLCLFQDYIHRVGRTARAGRSGKAISFVTQYDVELYQRIEHLLDKKLPLYPIEERVSEAQRVAKMVKLICIGKFHIIIKLLQYQNFSNFQDLRELEEKGQGGIRGGKKRKGPKDDNDDTETSSGVRKRVKNAGFQKKKK